MTVKTRVHIYKGFISQDVNYVGFDCDDSCIKFRTDPIKMLESF